MAEEKSVLTNSPEQTQHLAEDIAQIFLNGGGIILLSGELGAGKTTFIQGFIKSFGIKNHINSPTFLIVKQYAIPNSERLIFHLDLYRLEQPINLKESGISEILETSDQNIVLIEWPEKLGQNLPEKFIKITIEKPTESTRQFIILNSEF